MTTYALALLVFAIFVWLIAPTTSDEPKPTYSNRKRMPHDDSSRQEKDRGKSVGIATGLTGGNIAEAATTNYALNRLPPNADPNSARTLGNVIGMQIEARESASEDQE